MNRRFDENIDNAYEAFHQNHDALRDEFLNTLPQRETNAKRVYRYGLMRGLMRGQTMNGRSARLAAAATIIVAILLGIHYLGVSPDGTTVAWADVLKNVEAAKTVTYRWEFEKPGEREVADVSILEPNLRRSDIIEGGGRYNVAILDTLKRKCITCYPNTKSAVIGNEEGPGFRIRTYEKLKKDLRDGTEKDLGHVELNGRDTICFEIVREEGKTTVWADPKTALPIQVETLSEAHGGTKSLQSDIRFDVELDEGLFEPPADYCVLDLETQQWTTPFELTEQHLLDGLAVYPKYLDGKFRTRYLGGPPMTDALKAKLDAEIEKLNWTEEEGFRSSLGCAFIEQLPEGSDYQYVGEDVRFGDASKAVCWYRPQGSETYRVIYGDLSVKDVEPNDLPPIPWLAEQQ